MRLRFGIPFMLLLWVLAAWASYQFRFDARYLLIGVSAAWIAVDSRRIGITAYRTQLALPAIPLGVAAVVAWWIVFPWYLRVRYRITHGRIEPGPVQQRTGLWLAIVFAAAVVLALVASFAATKEVREKLRPVAVAVVREFNAEVTVESEAGSHLIVTLAIRDDEPWSEEIAEQVAVVALRAYPRPAAIGWVTVRGQVVERRGSVTITRPRGKFTFVTEDLRITDP